MVSPGDLSVGEIHSLLLSGLDCELHSPFDLSTDASNMHLLLNSQNWCLYS